ncbi:MAG: glycosyltransferase [Caldilineaceae bacterium]
MCHLYCGDALKPAYEQEGIPVVSLNLAGKYSVLQAISRVAELLRSQQPEIIHTTLFRADVVGRIAGWLTRVPVISSFVNEPYHPTRKQAISAVGRAKLEVVQGIDRLTARLTHHFVAVSHATQLSNCQALGIPKEKVSVIYRARNPEPFLNVSADQVHALRAELGLPQQAPILLNVARLLQRKGHEELLQAMPIVLQHFPDARLLIAGEGHDRPRLVQAIKRQGLENAVHLLGMRHDIPILLQLADLFVFPSHYEGHPGALIEAMVAARPIVASAIPVHQETITQNETGRLVPLQNPKALAEAMIQTLQCPQQANRMGAAAQKAALQNFHIDHVANNYEQLYTTLVQRLKGQA